ncbi:MAG: pilus assembly protein [Rhodospirillaceae bacterium]
MKTKTVRRGCSLALIASLVGSSYFAAAEDIDLFVGAASTATAMRPNVLVIIDNSANWSAASQHWPGGLKQGESELRALRTVAGEMTDKVNMGLMLATEGSGGAGVGGPGGYVRYAIRQMNAANKAGLQELIGDASCVASNNSINGTPNCIFKNFDTATEKVATQKTNYSAIMFEAFKYFGGFTDPAHSKTDTAGTPIDQSHFGPLRYAGSPDSKSDPYAFSSAWSTYSTPITSANSCAKNYIIFIGNGFPTNDTPPELLSGINGSTSQLTMPQFTTVSTTQTATIGAACGTGNNTSQRLNNCASNIPQSLKDANPADSYTCTGTGVVDTATCPGTNTLKFDVQSSKLVITVEPTGTSALPGSEARYTDEWAKYLFTTDVSEAIGQQNVRTYTIDVFKDAQDSRQTALLYNMAKVGGGRYYQASSESAILNAMREILVEIQAENSVFAAAALPVSATNRAQNENQVFFGMFRPDAEGLPRWYGNLKRYQVAKNTAGTLVLADQNGDDAIAATGFFKACAASFWTTDTSTYWNFSPTATGECTTAATSVYSDLPDGPLVEKGGAAEVLRKGNVASPATATYAVNRNMYTCTSTSPCPTTTSSGMVPFNTTNVSQTAVGATDSTDHTRIIKYTQGYDVGKVGTIYGDENQNGLTTDTRSSIHGDIVHARPLPVNYGGTTGVVAYYGTNDGTFRAVRTNDGVELWSFVAPEHHASLRRLVENSPLVSYPNLPSGITPTPTAKTYFFDGTAGLYQNADNTTVWVFPTMRRGGRMLYAFDVTDPVAPVLKWRVGCPNLTNDTGCTPDYADIGQTWSVPNVARVKGYSGGNAPLIIMGGGYDNCEDSDISTPSCDTAKGKRVYVIDANTGNRVAQFQTERSVPADVALIDRNFDGLVDHAYVVDTGGNLYRIDFVDPTSLDQLSAGNWTITKIANVASNSARKFLFPPSVLYAGGKAYLAFGSGDRERPLLSNYPYVESIQNRFYMFVDTFVSGSPVNLDGSDLADNTTSSTCLTPTSTLRGWRFDLAAGRGEQTVTSSLISGGRIFFNTHRATEAPANQCSADLGEARGYNVGLLCADRYSVVYSGIGLAISPVQGTVTLPSGEAVTFVLGGASDPNTTSPFPPGKITPSISQKRSRQYWYRHGDK